MMESLSGLCSAIVRCRECDLHFSRKKAVCGTGPKDAPMMIVGEAPGSAEDEAGIPFVGRSGKLLNEVLASLKVSRSEIYITNSVRCRPKVGQAPKINEVRTCSRYLKEEISIVSPRLVVPMGNSALFALGFVLDKKFEKISEVAGKLMDCGMFFVFPQFHPAAILRNPKRREYFVENFQKAVWLLRDIQSMPRLEIARKYRALSI
ncbi:MAG: uracil-DNA glycosylase [Candidatus Thermoplasmatota archaeon]|nr:uracil-DNA glycosylase [Candidatus Thermoplasmatota archaeon]